MYTINIWPFLISAVVSFAIGALWYSPILFGKEWMRLTKMTEADMAAAKASGVWKSYLSHFIATVVMLAVLGFFIATSNAVSATDGAFLGFVAWLGFIAPIGLSGMLWKREPFKLVLIDTIQVLISLIIGGAIMGAWK